jgi:hypothetical protein
VAADELAIQPGKALQILGRQFTGSRPAPSGRHQRWDRIIASVSRPAV